MRLTKSRIGKIESQTDSTAIEEHAEPLAALLGSIDAIFWPSREYENLTPVVQLRRKYLAGGIPWIGSSIGGSSREWKSSQRLREKMASGGLVKLTKSKSNLPTVKLTPIAEQTARAMVGQPADPVACGLLRMRLEQGATEKTPQHRAGGWVSESWLFNSRYQERPTSTDWDRPTVLILPMLVAGVAASKPPSNAAGSSGRRCHR